MFVPVRGDPRHAICFDQHVFRFKAQHQHAVVVLDAGQRRRGCTPYSRRDTFCRRPATCRIRYRKVFFETLNSQIRERPPGFPHARLGFMHAERSATERCALKSSPRQASSCPEGVIPPSNFVKCAKETGVEKVGQHAVRHPHIMIGEVDEMGCGMVHAPAR